jgi:hypothetical protein
MQPALLDALRRVTGEAQLRLLRALEGVGERGAALERTRWRRRRASRRGDASCRANLVDHQATSTT